MKVMLNFKQIANTGRKKAFQVLEEHNTVA